MEDYPTTGGSRADGERSLLGRHACLQLFEPVKDHLDSRDDGRSGWRLYGIDNANDPAVWTNVESPWHDQSLRELKASARHRNTVTKRARRLYRNTHNEELFPRNVEELASIRRPDWGVPRT